MTNVFRSVAHRNAGHEVGWRVSAAYPGQYVTPSFFTVLGTRPLLAHSPKKAPSSGEVVAVLTEGLWQDMFARDPDVTGKDI
jgi:hypothetical protein